MLSVFYAFPFNFVSSEFSFVYLFSAALCGLFIELCKVHCSIKISFSFKLVGCQTFPPLSSNRDFGLGCNDIHYKNIHLNNTLHINAALTIRCSVVIPCAVMLSVFYADCHYAKCLLCFYCFAECHITECL
jgi:hypothetical protein